MSLVETHADGNCTIIDGSVEDHKNLPTQEEHFVLHAFLARFAQFDDFFFLCLRYPKSSLNTQRRNQRFQTLNCCTL